MKLIDKSGIKRISTYFLLLLVLGSANVLTSQYSAKQEKAKAAAQKARDIENSRLVALRQSTPYEYTNEEKAEPSVWQNKLRQKALNVLASSSSDLLVIPVQSSAENHEFDATTRSLITLSTTHALINANHNVTDPILLAETLGLNRSTFDENEIAEIADKVNASKVLLSFIDHDDNNKLNLRFVLFKRNDSNPEHNTENKSKEVKSSWHNFEEVGKVSRKEISFDATRLPYYAYRDIQHELLSDLFGIDSKDIKIPLTQYNINLENSAAELLNSQPDEPLATAKKLQFLALLHPQHSTERSGLWFYERSLIELDRLETTAHVDFLRASALIALNRRPAAMALLQTIPDSAEKNALQEYANGNLISNDKLATITDAVERLSANIRNQRLRSTYKLTTDDTIYEELDGQEIWRHLAFNALNDGNVWRSTDNSYLKSLLDHIQPDNQLSFASITTRQSLSRSKTAASTMEKAILDHIEKIDTTVSPTSSRFRIADLLHLARAQLTENIHGSIYLETFARGRTQVAEEYVEAYEPLFTGQPDFSIIAGATYNRLAVADNTPVEHADTYRKKAEAYSIAGFQHANRPGSRTYKTQVHLKYLRKLSYYQQQRLLGESQWPATCQTAIRQFEQCLENTISGFHLLTNLTMQIPDTDQEKISRILAANHNRFKGNESRLDYLYTTYQTLGDEKGISLIEQEIENSDSIDWPVLKRMADSARMQSKYNDAADILLRYNELTNDQKVDNLKATNRSYDFASRMYWAGAHKAAHRIYDATIAVATGSNSELSAHARLATIDGDYMTAAQYQYQRIQRYQSGYAMRDLMGLLTIISGGDEALQLSHSLTPFLTQPQVWHGSLFAHRANGSSLQQQAEWLDSVRSDNSNPAMSGDREQQQQINRFSNIYLLMSAFQDRTINSESVKYIADNIKKQPRRFMLASNATEDWIAFPENPPTKRPASWQEKSLQPVQLAAAQVMQALYAGEFKAAEKLLNADRLCHALHETDEFLWLCAWAASHTGRGQALALDIETKTSDRNRQMKLYSDLKGGLFDNNIALAMLYGFEGRHDESINLLYRANADHRYTDGRSLLVRYHLLEVARILFDDSNDQRYKAFILEQARNYTVTDPIAAYNHSFIAMLSDDRDERITALLKLTHLDPESRAITLANEKELEEANRQAKNGQSAMTQYEGDDI